MSLEIKNTLDKKDRLYLKKAIDELFANGNSFIAYPIRIVYKIVDKQSVFDRDSELLVSVSKKYHKRANKRNRLKRLMREAYRLNRKKYIESIILNNDNKKLNIAMMYISMDIYDYHIVEKATIKAFNKIINREIDSNENNN